MAGTNQITWADKVNTKTLDIPRINKIIDADLNEIKTKFNALDTIVTDPITGLDAVKTDQTDVENIIAIEVALNHPTQLGLTTVIIDEVESEVATVVQPDITISGTVGHFRFPAVMGTINNPIFNLTLDFTGAKRNTLTVYLNAQTIPSVLEGANVRWFGTAFNTGLTEVNELKITNLSGTLKVENTVFESEITDVSLKGFWNMEEETEPFIAYDSSLYNHTATQVDANISEGSPNGTRSSRVTALLWQATRIIGSSLATNRFNVPYNSNLSLVNGFTWMGWLNLPIEDVTLFRIAGMGGASPFDGGWSLEVSNPSNANPLRVSFALRFGGSGSSLVSANSVITLGVDFHLAVTYDRTVRKIYLNGVEIATGAYTNDVSFTEADIIRENNGLSAFGGNISGSVRVNSNIDNVRFFTRGLPLAEIETIYNAENAIVNP
jgi:hypothetical protein